MGDQGSEMEEREAAIRAAAEHVAQMRRKIEDGRAEIERQRASVSGLQQRVVDMEPADYDDAA